MATLVIGIVLDGGRKQGVDKRGLSQSRFSSNLYSGISIQLPLGGLARDAP